MADNEKADTELGKAYIKMGTLTLASSGILGGLAGIGGIEAVAYGIPAIGLAAGSGVLIGTGIDELTGASGKLAASQTSEMVRMVTESGNSTSMKRKDPETGLPMITIGQNTELARVVASGSVEEAGKLSPNPALAAKGIHNFEDPAYIDKKIEMAEASLAKFDGRNLLQRQFGSVDQAKIVLEADLGAARTQSALYKVEFKKWEQQTGVTKQEHAAIESPTVPDVRPAAAVKTP